MPLMCVATTRLRKGEENKSARVLAGEAWAASRSPSSRVSSGSGFGRVAHPQVCERSAMQASCAVAPRAPLARHRDRLARMDHPASNPPPPLQNNVLPRHASQVAKNKQEDPEDTAVPKQLLAPDRRSDPCWPQL